MYEHIIAITSSYDLGERIAWHYSEKELSMEILLYFKKLLDEQNLKFGFSIHKLQTTESTWDSVVAKDSFFASVEVYSDLELFLQQVRKDQYISALDIAKYVLSRMPMSNLKLQKIIYLIYADFLSRTGEKLFEDKIVAYQYGPVIQSVYSHYKCNGAQEISDDSESKVILDEITIPITLAKILRSTSSDEIIHSINNVLDKYGDKKPSQLVDITHRSGTPWDIVYKSGFGKGCEIDDEKIKTHHHIERST
ncbi:MAG: Panacea domain-containing protein [Culicoidibacterales bacterium]